LAWVSICTFVKDGAMPNPATAAVAAALKRAQAPDSPWRTDYLDLSARTAGAFVSIHVAASDALRGCIGTIAPTKPDIPAEIMQNAVHAASEDPRFPPIRASELDGLAINVDILGAAETIRDRITLPEVAALSVPETLDAQRYGVIVSCGWRRGLLLPALDGVDTPLQQATIALNKAGISGSEPFRLQRFEVARYR
jgi:AmmeMemoRadiSam system protein A